MKRLKEIQEELVEARKSINDIHLLCEKEGRARTNEEADAWKASKEKIKELESEERDLLELQEDNKKQAAKKAEEEKRTAAATAGTGTSDSEGKEKEALGKRVSLSRAAMNIIQGRAHDGAEKEMHQLAEKEAGQDYRGFAIPSSMLETRTNIDQTTSNIKPTFVSNAYVDALRERAVYELVGATVHNGLTGDFKIPVVAKQSVAHASAENSAAADGGANFSSITLTPVRITGYADVSNRITLQNGEVAMQAIMRDFGLAVADTINDAMFSTTTVTNAPTSIAATSGVGTFTEASYSANASILSDFVEAEVTLAEAEGLTGNLAYVGAPNLLGDLKKSAQVASVTPAISGTLNYNQQVINGYRTYFTTGATSSAGVSGDFLFGNFAKVHVGYFGALNMIVDPLTQALTDQTRLVLHRNYDFKLAQGGAFVKATSLVA